MRRLIPTLASAIVLLMALIEPALAQKECDQFRHSTTADAQSMKEIIPGISGKRVYLCGWAIINSGSGLTINLVSGTGINCNSEQTPFVGPVALPNNTTFVNRIATASGERTPEGHSVCLQITGTGNLTTMWYWAQF
jgi:hypothetical protein